MRLFFPRDAGQGCVCVYECVCFVFQILVCRTAERAAAGGGGGIVSHFFRVRIKKEDKWNVILIFFFLSFVQSDKDWGPALLSQGLALWAAPSWFNRTLWNHANDVISLSLVHASCVYLSEILLLLRLLPSCSDMYSKAHQPVCLSWPTGHATLAHCSTCVVRLAPPTFFRLNVCTLPSKNRLLKEL